MSLVVLEHAAVAYGGRHLFDDLNLRIDGTDRIGLVGRNGTGKSTLLRLITGAMSPHSGAVRCRRGLRIGFLPQELDIASDAHIHDYVLAAVPGRDGLAAQVEDGERMLAQAQADGDDDALMEAATALSDAHEALTHFEMHYTSHEAAKILHGLGFAPGSLSREVSTLSGGWRMRVALAALLFQRPDLLLLDEPTNHLDLPTITWLSEFLQRFSHAFILICHDQEFLNDQINRVVSLDPEGVRQFRGNYVSYLKNRAEEELVLVNQAKNIERERAQAQAFIDRFRAQANKAKAVQSRVKQLEKMETVRTLERREELRFRFPPCKRSGDHVLRIEGLAKRYGAHEVLRDVDLHVQRGDRIAILGANGAGKTTLLRMLAGEIEASAGKAAFGHNVDVGYYAQHHADALTLDATVFQEVSQRNRGLTETSIRTLLGAFLFHADDVEKKIRVLSGGERARVALACLLAAPGNCMLMDEPTNHLDLDASESLAEALASYDGTLLFVSHNRSFIRRLATKIWQVEDGHVLVYPGSFDDYLWHLQHLEDTTPTGEKPAKNKKNAASRETVAAPSAPSTPVVLSKKNRKERAHERAEAARRLGPLRRAVQQLEDDIAAVEAEQRARNLALTDPEVLKDGARHRDLLQAFQRDAERLMALQTRWEQAGLELEAAENDA